MAVEGMAPKIFAYVDSKGRPVPTVILQIAFGCLAFVNESSSGGGNLFTWLLALSGLANFFVYGSICLAHIRFRKAWALHGHTVNELPYKAQFGVWGSWFGLILNILCLIAQFYSALFPPGGSPNAEAFFESYLAAPLIILLYIIWKTYSWFKFPTHRPLYVSIDKIDIYSGMRDGQWRISGEGVSEDQRRQSLAARDYEDANKKDDRPFYKKAFDFLL